MKIEKRLIRVHWLIRVDIGWSSARSLLADDLISHACDMLVANGDRLAPLVSVCDPPPTPHTILTGVLLKYFKDDNV